MTTPDAFRDAEYLADVCSIPYENAADLTDSQQSATQRLRRHNEAVKKAQSAAKITLLDRCLRDLDRLVYCELSALYYMDCSITLFAIRAIIQLIFFTPKAPPFEPTRNQPFVVAVFASNAFCMFAHSCISHPQAGEASRGYLHGGLFVDFIGQKTPISVFSLLSLDLLLFVIDIIMMGLIIERVKTAGIASSTESTTTSATARDASEQQQDHDAEERGIRRNGPDSAPAESTNDGNDEISPPRTETSSIDERLERTELLTGTYDEHGARDSHALDMFASGEAVIMDIGLLDTIRDQWRYSPAIFPRRSTYVPSDETATFLRDRLGLQIAPDGRVTRVAR